MIDVATLTDESSGGPYTNAERVKDWLNQIATETGWRLVSVYHSGVQTVSVWDSADKVAP